MGVTTAEDKSPGVKIMVQLWFYSYLLGCMLLGQFHKLSLYQFFRRKMEVIIVPSSVLLRY